MKGMTAGAVGALLLLTAGARAQDGPGAREEARKELLALQGTWHLESLDEGKKGAKEAPKKRTLFVGGDVFLVREGEKILQAGTLRVMPAKEPKGVDAVVRAGEHEGNTMLGVYEVKGDRLKVCFDPEGDSRPKGFTLRPGLVVAVYKRGHKPDEVDIRGRYRCESAGADGKKQITTAEVQRHGDAYLIRWTVPGGVAYIGVGIRQGGKLSVAWTNRGTVGVSVYEIEKGPRLTGVYTEVGGIGIVSKEQLTPTRHKRTEVRAGRVPR